MPEVKAIALKAWAVLKKPTVSHALLALAIKSKYTVALVPLIAALLGLN